MTEAEAKTKACCGPATHDPANSVFNCVASRCMAWRWSGAANPDWKPKTSMSFPATNPLSEPPYAIPSKTDGYCGLAGQP